LELWWKFFVWFQFFSQILDGSPKKKMLCVCVLHESKFHDFHLRNFVVLKRTVLYNNGGGKTEFFFSHTRRKSKVIIYFLAFLGAAGFFAAGFLATGFLGAGFFATFGLAAGFLAATFGFLAAAGFFNFLAAGFLTLVAEAFLALGAFAFGLEAFFSAFSLAGNLNEPEAPLPLVWIKLPLATAVFKNFLMNGANLPQSTLYVAVKYFLMAGRDEPPLSFKLLMAATTIAATGGWVGLALGFLSFGAAFAFFALAGATGATSTGAGSDIFFNDWFLTKFDFNLIVDCLLFVVYIYGSLDISGKNNVEETTFNLEGKHKTESRS